MEFRKLSISDEKLVLRLNKTLRDNFTESKALKKFLEKPDNYFFAALEDEIVGFLYGYRLDRLTGNEKMLYIHEVGVLEEHWNKGIGTEMLNALREHCTVNGITKIFLFAESSNKSAIRLYEKQNAEKADADTIFFIKV